MTSPSTISASTVIRGNIGGEGSLEILGRVEGNVAMTGQVIIAAEAAVKGNVTATEIQVAGNVAGNLTASDVVMLNPGARVVGDLAGSRIGIAEGALVRGLVRTEGEPPLVKPAPVAAARSVATPAKPAASAPRAAFPAPAARPAPAPVVAPRPALAPPKVSVVAPVVHEQLIVQEPELDDDDFDSETIPPVKHEAPKHERSAEGPPPPVVPAIKGQTKAKKKFKGR
jgi:cytoskeletal protein CcmA (bactofilin family)